MSETQLRLTGMPTRPPQALSVSARWSDDDGWSVTAAARRAGSEEWFYATLRHGSALSVDELVTVAATLLERAAMQAEC